MEYFCPQSLLLTTCPNLGSSPHWAHGHTKNWLRSYKRSAGHFFSLDHPLYHITRDSRVSSYPQQSNTVANRDLVNSLYTSAIKLEVTYAASNAFSAAWLSEQTVTDTPFSSCNLGRVAPYSITNNSVWNTVLAEPRGKMYLWSSSWVYTAAPEGPLSPQQDPSVKQTILSDRIICCVINCSLDGIWTVKYLSN